MPEPKKGYLPLFASNVIFLDVEEDTDELKTAGSVKSANVTTRIEDRDSFRVLEKYPRVRDIILDKWKMVADEFFKYQHDFAITTSWITEVQPGSSSQVHSHYNSLISGVYYFDTYDEFSSDIEFINPLTKFQSFWIEPREPSLACSTLWTLPPRDKQLIFFPSYLEHRVAIHRGDETRYSLAFNIVPTGLIGGADSSYNNEWFK